MTKVANCGHDENYRYSGGKAGDQTGDEWYVRDDYDFGQKVYLVHPNDKVNDLVARMAVSGAKNDAIGYDQGQRTSFYAALKKNKWIVASIKTPCESDCSSGVAAIVIGAGNRLKDSKLAAVSKDCYTGNLKAALTKAGYKAYTKDELVKKYGKKPKGCIQLNESRHVNIVVDGAANLSSTATSTPSKTTWTAGTYVTQVDCLNVRTDAGTSYRAKKKSELTADGQKNSNSAGQLNKGTKVTVSQVKTVGSNVWGLIPSGWICLLYGGKTYAKKA